MEINAGDTAWVLASAALVMLMTPGLAFFYGGMVRMKSVLNMMMMSFITIAVVTIMWVLVGYSLTFAGDTGHVVGDFVRGRPEGPDLAGRGQRLASPTLAFVAFQLMFAIITPALISGAIADRAKFRGWIAFVVGWTLPGVLPGRALGLVPEGRRRRLDRRQARRRSTSPVVRRCT